MGGDSTYGLNTWIHGRGEKAAGRDPAPEAIRKLLAKIDENGSWCPGKRDAFMSGRPKALSETNRAVIAKSAMTAK